MVLESACDPIGPSLFPLSRGTCSGLLLSEPMRLGASSLESRVSVSRIWQNIATFRRPFNFLISPASYKPRTRDPVKILWGSGVPSFAEAALPAPKALPGVPIAAPDLGTVQLARLGMKLSGVRTKKGRDRTGIAPNPSCESQKCLCIERSGAGMGFLASGTSPVDSGSCR